MGVKTREKDGVWYVFCSHKNRRKAKMVGQKKAANKLRKELEAVLHLQGWDGLLLHLGEGPEDTIETFGRVWLASPQEWATSTREAYTSVFDSHIVPRLGKKRLTEVKRIDVINLVNGLVNEGKSASRINTVTVTLSGIFLAALDAEIVNINPCRDLGKHKKKGQQTKGNKPTHRARGQSNPRGCQV